MVEPSCAQPHPVVAYPMLYDTSTSTAGGDSSDSSVRGYFPKSHPNRSNSSSSRHYHSHSLAVAAKAAGRSGPASWAPQHNESKPDAVQPVNNNNNNEHAVRDFRRSPTYVALQRQRQAGGGTNMTQVVEENMYRTTSAAQSEPGVGLYGNKSSSSRSYPQRPEPKLFTFKNSGEEKKDDHTHSTNGAASQQSYYPDPDLTVLHSLDPSDRQDDLPAFEQQRGRRSTREAEPQQQNEQQRPRSNSRTRSLAQRFEKSAAAGTTVRLPLPCNQENILSPSKSAVSDTESHSYRDRVEIETPTPARVNELKQKLWAGDGERLKFSSRQYQQSPPLEYAVTPSHTTAPHHHHAPLDAAKTLYPRSKTRRSLSPGPNHYHPYRRVEYDAATAANTVNTTVTSGEDHESSVSVNNDANSNKGSSDHNHYHTSPAAAAEIHTTATSSNHSRGSTSRGAGSSSGAVFKSRFYEAAQRNMSTSPARSAIDARSSSRASAISAAAHKKAHSGSSTVDTLLAQLVAVNRDDPSAALAEIDAILRDQSQHHTSNASGAAVSLTSSPPMTPARVSTAGQSAADQKSGTDDDDAKKTVHSSSTAGRKYVALGDPEDNFNLEKNSILDSQDGDDGDDDDSTLSSITNPTFQGHQGATTTSNKNTTTATNVVPTVSSLNRHPRPSSLSAYNNAPLRSQLLVPVPQQQQKPLGDDPKPSSSRKKKPRSPPPPMISTTSSRTSDSKKMSKSSSSLKSQPAAIALLPADSMDISADDAHLQHHPAPLLSGPIDSSNSQELAEKIRRWDVMTAPDFTPVLSNESTYVVGLQPVTTSDETVVKNIQAGGKEQVNAQPALDSPPRISSGGRINCIPSVRSSGTARPGRPHPWDSSIPVALGKVEMRDTSMESAIGVETQYYPKYSGAVPCPPDRHQDTSQKSAAARLRHNEGQRPVSPIIRKERLGREMDSAIVNQSAGEQERLSHEDGGSVESDDSGFIETPSSQRVSPSRNENAMSMADDFDSAWVSVPTSTFFSAELAGNKDPSRLLCSSSREVRQHHRSSSPVHTRNRGEQPRSLQKIEPQTEQPSSENRPIRLLPVSRTMYEMRSAYDQSAIGTAVSTEESDESGVEVALKPRRGLRAMLRGRRGSNSNREDTLVLDQSSVSSASNGIKSQSALDGKEVSPPTGLRGRRPSKSPSRVERARSLSEGRIRNPGIAKKFSRLLRVYDSESKGYI